ncbi:MAG: SlyX family protein [Desulfobulbaceae bacterium]|nr:SlyX family protein [Desulfobulbaceae bacterium]
MATERESLAARIVEVETRLAFQDHTIEELNEVVTGQQRQLDELQADFKVIRARLKQLLSGSEQSHGH